MLAAAEDKILSLNMIYDFIYFDWDGTASIINTFIGTLITSIVVWYFLARPKLEISSTLLSTDTISHDEQEREMSPYICIHITNNSPFTARNVRVKFDSVFSIKNYKLESTTITGDKTIKIHINPDVISFKKKVNITQTGMHDEAYQSYLKDGQVYMTELSNTIFNSAITIKVLYSNDNRRPFKKNVKTYPVYQY